MPHLHNLQPVLVATSNAGKLAEFAAAARGSGLAVEALPDLKTIAAPEETGTTFECNAALKARYYSRFAAGRLVLCDDSGLAAAALDGDPGVCSARYAASSANPHPSDEDNNRKLLAELASVDDGHRQAAFICVLAAAMDGELLGSFRGEVRGTILREPRGRNGFGYDPVFLVDGTALTMAEMHEREKLQHSHRGQAFAAFARWMASR